MFGIEGCRCIDGSPALASITARSCLTSEGNAGVMLKAEGPCVPHSYGASSCLKHDFLHDPKCKEVSSVDYPDYCIRPWCYVNAKSCMQFSTEQVYRSDYFPASLGVDLFYSYTTCNSTAEDWINYHAQEQRKMNIEVAVPQYSIYMSKPTTIAGGLAGSEYYNESVPYEGAMKILMDDIQQISNGELNITYTFVSKASKQFYKSPYTAAVQDIQNGLVDMAVGPFWITAERLKMAAFTVPISYDKTVLVVKDPGDVDESVLDQMNKTLEPFANGVWVVILAIIVITASLSVWFSEGQLYQANHPGRLKKRLVARWALDEFLQKSTFFNSAGVEQENGANLPSKLLMFGFSFFVLIVVSAYVANLAAFLTQRVGTARVETVDSVVAFGIKICAHEALRTELETAYPRANFVYTNGIAYMIDMYKASKCSVLAVSEFDAINDMKIVEKLCETSLIFTESIFIENPIGFPIKPELAPRLSHWIYNAEKLHNIDLESSMVKFNEKHHRVPSCSLQFSEIEQEPSDMAQIRVEHLAFPLLFFTVAAIVAIALQLYHHWYLRKGYTETMMGRFSDISQRHLVPPRHGNRDNDSSANNEDSPLPNIHQPKLDSSGVARNDSAKLVKFCDNSSCRSDKKEPDCQKNGEVNESNGQNNGEVNATSRLQTWVETGLIDDVIDCVKECVQELKKQKQN